MRKSSESGLRFEDRNVSSRPDYERVSCKWIVGWVLGKNLTALWLNLQDFQDAFLF